MQCSGWMLLLASRMKWSSAGLPLMEATVSGPQVRAGGHFWAEWIKVGLILNQVLEHRLQPQLWHAAERRIRDETAPV